MNARKVFTIAIIASLFASFIAIPVMPVAAAGTGTIVFDYSHGQENSNVADVDAWLDGNLTAMGYTCVWAKGGINSSILSNAKGLVIGSIYGVTNGFAAAEVTAIGNWYGEGKFLWIGYDSDYDGLTYINDNMTMILEAVDSHVYGEPSAIADPISNCEASYRPVATGTSTHFTGVDAVLCHGPTLLYGSNSTSPGENVNPVALEDETIDGVTPILFYNESATISDGDILPPYAHTDGAEGEFVAATWEALDDGVCVVSGASPYGDYQPMSADEYYDVELDGMSFVTQVIDKGMNGDINYVPSDMTMILLIGGVGVVVIVIIVAIIFMRKK